MGAPIRYSGMHLGNFYPSEERPSSDSSWSMGRSCRGAHLGLRGRCIRGTRETPPGAGLPGRPWKAAPWERRSGTRACIVRAGRVTSTRPKKGRAAIRERVLGGFGAVRSGSRGGDHQRPQARDEQCTRSNRESLMATSPVGMVVFNVQSGLVVSYNPEARCVVGHRRPLRGEAVRDAQRVASQRGGR